MEQRKRAFDDNESVGRWFLGESSFAAGITVCRYARSVPDSFGLGEAYEYHVLDTNEFELTAWPGRLCRPDKLTTWSYLLLMVFQGALENKVAGGVVHRLNVRDYAYISRKVNCEWRPVIAECSRSIAAAVFY